MEIAFKNGDVKIYNAEDYTEYRWFGDVFVVIRDTQWIGIYSMDAIKSIEIKPVK